MSKLKTVLITGGSRGIGKSIAKKFASNNYNIVFTYSTNTDAANKTYEELIKYNVKVLSIKVDFNHSNSIVKMFDIYKKQFDTLDVLINNAAWTKYLDSDRQLDLSQDIFDKIINVNLKSIYFIIQSAVPLMINGDNSSIINISSIASYNGIGSNIAYCASKAGINSFTKSFAKLLGPKIRVNGIAPGLTQTDLTETAPKSYLVNQLNQTPLDRLATPDDISDVAYSLAHDMQFVNGKTIVVDGGSLN